MGNDSFLTISVPFPPTQNEDEVNSRVMVGVGGCGLSCMAWCLEGRLKACMVLVGSYGAGVMLWCWCEVMVLV